MKHFFAIIELIEIGITLLAIILVVVLTFPIWGPVLTVKYWRS